jgi:hypothetical protein
MLIVAVTTAGDGQFRWTDVVAPDGPTNAAAAGDFAMER